LRIVSAGTAFAWATDLSHGYGWWFRLGGLAALGLLVWLALCRRDQCSIAGVVRWRGRLLGLGTIAVGTYGALYALRPGWGLSPDVEVFKRERAHGARFGEPRTVGCHEGTSGLEWGRSRGRGGGWR
jgi:hypothetical protein